ncbi:hypothetical protein N7492_002753 [Penicillium capsulatum]|uniref:STEEP1 domain-containing protein n=1 Tax=Penicillium capsulatum TaxID=69766 RepID=A0A9W9LVI4_9EURO|nr:hypothetical protein N7492_002753 [Penicillium capsulatum]KAJ6122649.1 hypothetical protein N7512_005114 [Penicillium capsulatum]
MSDPTRLPIRTQHCRFCSHLLLATTRDLAQLPRRDNGSQDKALILPLESTQGSATATDTRHATLLLSTTIPDRRATLIRREDGIEKRILLRCGRCRVVVGYYLDRVHWAGREKEDREEDEERPPAVYVLPGAVVETEKMGGEGVGEREWRGWNEGAA